MEIIENNPLYKEIIYQDSYSYNNTPQVIYFQKTYMKVNNRIQYFFESYLKEEFFNCQAYIYFYLAKEMISSNFMGIDVKSKYRNTGLACYNFLSINKKQRKLNLWL